MPRMFELREKSGRGSGRVIMTGDSMEELAEKLAEKTGKGGELSVEDESGGWF